MSTSDAEPIHGLDIVRYARLSARFAEGVEPRANVLREIGLDEMDWLTVERGWLVRIGSAAMKGDLSLLQAYERTYVETQDALGPTEPTHGLAEFAAVIRALSKGEDARDVFPRHGLTLASCARLQRAWAKRMAADPHLADAYRDLVEKE